MMEISYSGIKFHNKNICRKPGVANRNKAVRERSCPALLMAARWNFNTEHEALSSLEDSASFFFCCRKKYKVRYQPVRNGVNPP